MKTSLLPRFLEMGDTGLPALADLQVVVSIFGNGGNTFVILLKRFSRVRRFLSNYFKLLEQSSILLCALESQLYSTVQHSNLLCTLCTSVQFTALYTITSVQLVRYTAVYNTTVLYTALYAITSVQYTFLDTITSVQYSTLLYTL